MDRRKTNFFSRESLSASRRPTRIKIIYNYITIILCFTYSFLSFFNELFVRCSLENIPMCMIDFVNVLSAIQNQIVKFLTVIRVNGVICYFDKVALAFETAVTNRFVIVIVYCEHDRFAVDARSSTAKRPQNTNTI